MFSPGFQILNFFNKLYTIFQFAFSLVFIYLETISLFRLLYSVSLCMCVCVSQFAYLLTDRLPPKCCC